MKNSKSILSIFAFALAIFGATATNIFASNEVTALRPLATFYKSDCTQVTADCGTNSVNPVCRTSYPSGDQIFDQTTGGACTITVYKP